MLHGRSNVQNGAGEEDARLLSIEVVGLLECPTRSKATLKMLIIPSNLYTEPYGALERL